MQNGPYSLDWLAAELFDLAGIEATDKHFDVIDDYLDGGEAIDLVANQREDGRYYVTSDQSECSFPTEALADKFVDAAVILSELNNHGINVP